MVKNRQKEKEEYLLCNVIIIVIVCSTMWIMMLQGLAMSEKNIRDNTHTYTKETRFTNNVEII